MKQSLAIILPLVLALASVAAARDIEPSFESCPGGSMWDGSRCNCPDGTTWRGNACVPDDAGNEQPPEDDQYTPPQQPYQPQQPQQPSQYQINYQRAQQLNNEGLALWNAKRYRQAEAKFRAALALLPNDAMLRVNASNAEMFALLEEAPQGDCFWAGKPCVHTDADLLASIRQLGAAARVMERTGDLNALQRDLNESFRKRLDLHVRGLLNYLNSVLAPAYTNLSNYRPAFLLQDQYVSGNRIGALNVLIPQFCTEIRRISFLPDERRANCSTYFERAIAIGRWQQGDAAYRRGDFAEALNAYRQVRSLNALAWHFELDDKISDLESWLKQKERQASYIKLQDGFVAGTGAKFQNYYRIIPANQTAEQLRISEQTMRDKIQKAGINPDKFIALKDYDFVIGLAASSWKLKDLSVRVAADQLSNGKATPEMQADYDHLRGKSFEQLDCHSNGAMICLAALRRGDITARRVRLYGPQLSDAALRDWARLLDPQSPNNHIDDLEIVLAEHDPIPAISLLADRLRVWIGDGSDQQEVLRGNLNALISIGKSTTVCDRLDGCRTIPSMRFTRLQCDAGIYTFVIGCHDLVQYREKYRGRTATRY
jgi:hypothetical protein